MLCHAVFEGFAAVNEYDGNFVGKLAAQAIIAFHVNIAPHKAAAAL